MSDKRARPASSAHPRSAARLAAVQALYDWELSGAQPEVLLDDVLHRGLGGKALLPDPDNEDGEVEKALTRPDESLLGMIVRGVLAGRESLDTMVTGALSADWPVERLEAVLKAILRAGAFELASMPATPARVVISEYVDVAHAFYAGPEPKLVNAVLDRIAKVVRDGELDVHAAG